MPREHYLIIFEYVAAKRCPHCISLPHASAHRLSAHMLHVYVSPSRCQPLFSFYRKEPLNRFQDYKTDHSAAEPTKVKTVPGLLAVQHQKLNLSSKSHNSIGEKRRLHSSTKKEDQTKLRHSRKHSKGWNGYPWVVLLFSPRPRSAIHRPFG